MESMRASTTDDNAAFADSDKSNVKIYFLTVPKYYEVVYILFHTGMRISDDHVIIRLKLDKPSKYAGLS